ncbi:Rz-like lysis system protein LysB [Pseudomonas japonica]|uniref:Rz-like lysis system protein LysB n=1 Tax=Pseudomonas japonica TaxID=256466 RepID=UPI0015E2E857|nr:Rz-like lysis system protein LysB [Pseudomonas japonica]MBA1289182.1 LysB family phage lysis regulatory protein [Pseudomonas japonica]
MSLLRQGLYGVALLLVVILFIRLNHLERTNAQASIQAARDERDNQRSAAANLLATLQAERAAQQRLRREHDQLAGLAEARKRLIKDLKRENTAFKHWADQPLPDLVRRLHQRPALTGSAAYREWLSRRGALHPDRDAAP